MSFGTVNGIAITSGRFTFRLQGAWTAVLSVATDDPTTISGPVVLQLGATTLRGYALNEGADSGDAVSLRVVGGSGGLSNAAPPHAYGLPTTYRAAITDLLAVGKEVLSPSIPPGTLDRTLPQWVRIAGSVADSLWRLVEHMKLTWRIDTTGAVWIGTDFWEPLDGLDLTIDDEDPANKTIIFAVDELIIMPGKSFDGQHIAEVVYEFDDRQLRASARYGTARGGMEEQLGRIVASETAHLDYLGTYLAKAVGQSGQTLELKPYDPRWAPLSQVKVLRGIPGVTDCQMIPGLDVAFAFENGDPSQPRVVNFDASSTLRSLVIEALQEVLLKSTRVVLGASAEGAQAAALAPLVDAALSTVATWSGLHVHSGGTLGGSTGPPAAPVQFNTVAAKNVFVT